MHSAKILSILIVCSMTLSAISKAQENEIKILAKKSVKIVGGALKKGLKKEIKKNGFTGAADFCSMEGRNIIRNANKLLAKGVSVKRITSKPRNKLNEASAEQKKILEDIRFKKSKYKMPKMVIKEINKKHTQVYIPIITRSLCLKCHGTASTIDKKAYGVILKQYPYDKAIGYKNNDLRGAFLVDIFK